MTLDIKKLRDDTPGCSQVLHFNNAGAALPPFPVIDAIKQHIDLEATIGGYEAHAKELQKIEKFYDHAAKLINCSRDEIAFSENATRAWDMAFYSLKFNKGDKIITAAAEYASNYLAFLHMAKHTGAEIVVVNNDESGQLDINDLKNKIDEKVKLIAITHVPTNGGLVNPAIEVGKIAREARLPYMLDTTQSVGQMPIDVQEIGCDFLCATGRKFLRGPRGTGFLYINRSKIAQSDPPFIDLYSAKWTANNEYILRNDARRFETWEQNIAAKLGLSVALDYASNLGIVAIWERIQYLAKRLREQLSQLSQIKLQDLGKNKCGIVTFSHQSMQPDVIQAKLLQQKINVSISLQEYARLDMVNRNLPAIVRASVHYYNTEDEVDRFCRAIEKLSA